VFRGSGGAGSETIARGEFISPVRALDFLGAAHLLALENIPEIILRNIFNCYGTALRPFVLHNRAGLPTDRLRICWIIFLYQALRYMLCNALCPSSQDNQVSCGDDRPS